MRTLIMERIIRLRWITLMISMMLISTQLLAQPRRKEHVVEYPNLLSRGLVPRAHRQGEGPFCLPQVMGLPRLRLSAIFSNDFNQNMVRNGVNSVVSFSFNS